MHITKASGLIEDFQPEKLKQSLVHAGMSPDHANRIVDEVRNKVKPGDSTTKIFRQVVRLASRTDFVSTIRYSLPRALDALGPTGFLFEQYVEALLQSHGYTTQRDIMIAGECIIHEVDVFAQKGDLKYLVEAKYRNRHTIKTHVDQVMYADARLMDIQRRAEAEGKDPKEYTMWVITNTQFTSAATHYAQCRGVKLMGWHYPRGEDSLESMIMRTQLYPITVIPGLSSSVRDMCAKNNIILVQDLLGLSGDTLQKTLGISGMLAERLLRDARKIITIMKSE